MGLTKQPKFMEKKFKNSTTHTKEAWGSEGPHVRGHPPTQDSQRLIRTAGAQRSWSLSDSGITCDSVISERSIKEQVGVETLVCQ